MVVVVVIWRIPKFIARHIIGNRKYVFRRNLRISTEPQLHIFRTTERTKTVHTMVDLKVQNIHQRVKRKLTLPIFPLAIYVSKPCSLTMPMLLFVAAARNFIKRVLKNGFVTAVSTKPARCVESESGVPAPVSFLSTLLRYNSKIHLLIQN